MDTDSPIIPDAEAQMQKLESNFTELTLTLQLFLNFEDLFSKSSFDQLPN
jgi:hypothetical protein